VLFRSLNGQVVVELEGRANPGGGHPADQILRQFESGLLRRYPPIAALKHLPQRIENDGLPFHSILTISDQPVEVSNEKTAAGVLSLDVTLPTGLEPEAVATVAALRARNGQSSATVHVQDSGDIAVPFKD